MAALPRLNMNEIPYYTWKGKTLEQVTSVLRKNTNILNQLTNDKFAVCPSNKSLSSSLICNRIFKAMPLKIYRREIAVINSNPSSATSCSRASSTIAAFEQPGGSIIHNTHNTKNTGLVNTLDIMPTTITSEHPGLCAYPSNCFTSPDLNAKRRVRSAGMYPKKFKLNNNNDKAYFSSTTEYLVSRNRTIKQNSYIYFRQGNSGVQPGTGNSKSNIYSSGNIYTPGGISHCYQPMISKANNNNYFTYTWINTSQYTVTIPDGYYNTESLNNYFKKVMIQNTHFYKDDAGNFSFLLSIDYDNFNNKVILEANPAVLGDPYPSTWPIWNNYLLTNKNKNDLKLGDYGYTCITIPLNNKFGNVVGFPPSSYNGKNISQFHPEIAPNYVPLYYKPSNVIFGIQGPVDSSTYTDRRKVNAVTRDGYLTKSAYGTATANAMAYGVSEQPYTLKNIVGFPQTATPIIQKNGKVCFKKKFIYRM
jgi:hypothetical protein